MSDVVNENMEEAFEAMQVNEIQSDVVYRGILDLPPNLLIKILYSVPVKERVRASGTCMAFYDVLSGPHAFSDVKRLPGPEISDGNFRKMTCSDVKTRAAMAKRLRSSVSSVFLLCKLCHLSRVCTVSFIKQLQFLSELENVSELSIMAEQNDTSKHIPSYFTDFSAVQLEPNKLQVSKLVVRTVYGATSLSVVLSRLACILDFGSVRCLEVMGQIKGTLEKLKIFFQHGFVNLQKFNFDFGRCNAECDFFCELLLNNVGGLKDVALSRPMGDPTSLLSALCQLNLERLDIHLNCNEGLDDRSWLTDLAANNGKTLESLSFRPASDHALDFIQLQPFKKLTNIILKRRGVETQTSLTSVIDFIERRPDGLPKMSLQIAVEPTGGNENVQQWQQLMILFHKQGIIYQSRTVYDEDCLDCFKLDGLKNSCNLCSAVEMIIML